MKKQWLTKEVLEEVLAGKRMSASSRRSHVVVLGTFGKMFPVFPTKAIEINKWLVSLDGHRDTTCRLYFAVLRGVYKFMEANYEVVNPCKAVSAPSVRKRQRRYYKAEEVVLIIQACRDEFDLALIMTLVDSGCRVGEVAGLRGKDVGDGFIEVENKAGAKTGAHKYRLDIRLCERLRILAGGDDNYVFGGRKANSLSQTVARISKRAGMRGEKLGAHTLRHTSASLVAKETGNVLAVKALLQQENVQSSMVYIHDAEEDVYKRMSPLKLVSESVIQDGMMGTKQIALKGDGGVEEVEDVPSAFDVSMFPEIPDGVEVRSVLRTEDLRLINMAFVELAGKERYLKEVGRARLLMKRMLRKVKIAY